MKLESAFTIDGNVVRKVFSQGGVDVFHSEKPDSDLNVYFVNDAGHVILTQEVTCGMSQGTSFVDIVEYK